MTQPFLKAAERRAKYTRKDAEALFMQATTANLTKEAEKPRRQVANLWFWTAEEKRKIGVFSYNYYRDHPDASRDTAIAEAIRTVCMADRQHTVPYANVKLWLHPMWEEFDKQSGQEINKQRRNLIALKKSAEARAASDTPKEAKPRTRTTKNRVYWKPEESEKVALQTATILATDTEGEHSDLEAMRRAQQAALPEDRQRTINALAAVQDVMDRAHALIPVVRRNIARKAEEERIATELEARREREEAERVEREQREAELKERAEAEAAELAKKLEEDSFKVRAQQEAFSKAVAAEVSKQLDQATYPALIGAIAKKVMGDFMGSLSSQIETIVSEAAAKAAAEQVKLAIEKMPAKEVPAAVVQIAPNAQLPADVTALKRAPKDHMPKAIMVGLSYQQFDEIKKKFFGLCEFELVKAFTGNMQGSQAGMDMIAAAKRGADVVVAMTDHCGKDVKIAGRTKMEELGVPFVGITGSFSAARRWLEGWLNGEISLAA